jgi:hypothetical protein
MSQEKQLESSGGRVNYYLVQVDHPQREDQAPYQAECEDIIDALGCTPDEANILKEIWRSANERTHGKGKVGNTVLRSAEKIVHYGGRILRKAKRVTVPTVKKDRSQERLWSEHDQTGSYPLGVLSGTLVNVVDIQGIRYSNLTAREIHWKSVQTWQHAR